MSSEIRKIESKFIRKAFLVKFGNAFVIPEAEKNTVDVKDLLGKIRKCLDTSPLVKETEIVGIPHKHLFSFTSMTRAKGKSEEIESVLLSQPIRAKISLPVKNQKDSALDLLLFSEADCTEDFGILYNAGIFAVFREVDLSKKSHPGAPDIRELLLNTIESEKSWKMRNTYPNPLRENFFIVYLRDDQSTKENIGKTLVEDNSLYLYQSEKSLGKFEELLARILWEISPKISTYYSAIFQLEKMRDLSNSLLELHGSIQSTIAGLLQLSFFNIVGYYKNSKKLERLISKHYSSLLDYSSNVELFRQDAEDAKDALDKVFLLKPFARILMEELELERIDIETLTKCTSYARDVVQKSYTTKVTLLGALIGILGTVLGTLLLHYLGF